MSELDQTDERRPEIELAADLLDKFGIPASAVVKYLYARRARQLGRVAEVLTDAASRSGVTVEELMARAGQQEETSDLLELVLRAAAKARSTQHVRAMARVLAAAVAGGDGARVDDLPMIVDAIDRLGAVEIRCLAALDGVNVPTGDVRRFLAQTLGSDVLVPHVDQLLTDTFVIGSTDSGGTAAQWGLSPFGRRVLSFLADHAPSD